MSAHVAADLHGTVTYVLKRNGVVIKEFPTREQCLVEAYERGWVLAWGADFADDRPGTGLAAGVTIEVNQ